MNTCRQIGTELKLIYSTVLISYKWYGRLKVMNTFLVTL